MSRFSGSEHVSHLGFDRLLAGEVEDTEHLHAHLSECEQCRERYAALVAERDEHTSNHAVSTRVDALMAALDGRTEAPQAPEARRSPAATPGKPSRLVRMRWWSRWCWWAPVAAAAVILLFMSWPDEHSARIQRSASIRDAPLLQVFVVAEDNSARLLDPGERLAPGARLGFRAACERRCYVLLGARGPDTPAQVINDPPVPWQLEPGQPTRLPVSIAVDTPLDLMALFCADEPDGDASQRWPGDRSVPGGCTARAVRIQLR